MAPSTRDAGNTDDGSAQSRINPPNNSSIDVDNASTLDSAPRHPLPLMQAPFEESIIDSAMPMSEKSKSTAEARRHQILELDEDAQGFSSRWTQQSGAKFHPLWKLVAQISFGVHLLHKNLAKSEDEVIHILQRHVDEVDSFAEDTTADFDLAIRDIKERIQCLLLPLEHSRTFNKMLCDKDFRTSILEGNAIIERVIARTTAAMERSFNDIAKGMEAVVELAKYLDRLWADWPNQHHDLIDAYHVMRGNSEGWYRCFRRLQSKGDQLADLMDKLESILDEVALRAGIASRRKTPSGVAARKKQQIMEAEPVQTNRTSSHSAGDKRLSSDKPLPPPPPRRHSCSVNLGKGVLASKSSSPALSISTQARLPYEATTRPHSPNIRLPRETITRPQSPNIRLPHETITRPQSPITRLPHGTITRPQSPITRLPHGATTRPHSSNTQLSASGTQSTLARRHTTDFHTDQHKASGTNLKQSPTQASQHSPTDSLPSTTADSGYSSCPDTPALSPQSVGSCPTRTLSTTSTVAPLTPELPDIQTMVYPHKDVSEDLSNMALHDHRRTSNDTVTPLPVFKATPAFLEESRKYSVLKNPNVRMRSLFAKKPTRRDVSGGVGGCVIIT